MPLKQPPPAPEHKAYVSEPITRCPPREKGRITTMIGKMREVLEQDPYRTKLYVPSEITSPAVRSNMTADHVYLLDRIRVVEADFMIVIADHTSFGVGGEVEIATALGKPVVIISRDQKLSRFLTGTPANAVRAFDKTRDFILYRDWRDLKPNILPIIERILSEPASGMRLETPFWDVSKQIRKIREARGMSVEEVAERSGLRITHLNFLEKTLVEIRHELDIYEDRDKLDFGPISLTSYQLEQLTNIGLPVLHRLAVALETDVAELVGASGERPITKGPGREARGKIERIRQARTESLHGRASQYDVTFREYERLENKLVRDFMKDLELHNIKPAQKHQLIQEREFLDALAEVRRDLML